jgi:VanZ family protein
MLAVRVLSLVLVIAVLDEINQSFNPARTGSPVDVLIDLAGGGTALAVFMLICWRPAPFNGSSSPPE